MRTTDLSELAAFDAVARHRSFRRASEERGVTASAISHAVSNLESRIGIRLLNRTTRSVSLTDAGAMLLARLAPEQPVCVARELTKKFEEYRRGTAAEVYAHYTKHPAKGEICLVIGGTDLPKWARETIDPPA